MSGETELWGGSVERSTDGTTFTDVAKVKGIVLPTLSKSKRQITSLDSPTRVHEYKEGFGDPGQLEIRCIYTRDGYQAALTDQSRADSTFYRITLENGDAFIVEGVSVVVEVTGLDELDAIAEFALRMETSGSMQFTAGA